MKRLEVVSIFFCGGWMNHVHYMTLGILRSDIACVTHLKNFHLEQSQHLGLEYFDMVHMDQLDKRKINIIYFKSHFDDKE